ncbi:MAG: Ig-like domain-containing protein [Myxococcota bacterium]
MRLFVGWAVACSGGDSIMDGSAPIEETGSALQPTAMTGDTGLADPEVVQVMVTPASGELGVTQPVFVDFDVPMNQGSVQLGGTLVEASPVSTTWLRARRAGGDRLQIQPVTTWTASPTHTMTLTARSAAGTQVEASVTVAVSTQLAFVTTQRGTGDLSSWPAANGATGRAAGDAICTSEAAEAGLTGTFRALLSDGVSDAGCALYDLEGKMSETCGMNSFPSVRTWQRPDGLPLGDSATMFEAFLLHPLNQTLAKSPSGTVGMWYGTRPYNCGDWTRGDADVDGRIHWGIETRLRPPEDTWASNLWSCDSELPLVCLQIDESVPLSPPREAGLRVFVSSASGSANLGSWPEANGATGIAAGDAICQSLAAAAGLTTTGEFLALLSDPNVDAVDRFPAQGPWVRMDGALLGETFLEMLEPATGRPFDETGAMIEADPLARFHRVWTGTASSDGHALGNDQCATWTDESSNAFTAFGSYAVTGLWATSWSGIIPCFSEGHLYCVETP